MVIVILGPTGVGKTKMSIALAKKLNGEIINADSTQVFKGLDIATAKVKEDEKENIIHHLIDIKDIKENYTVFDFQKDCREKIDDILSRNKTPILVGGTGLYIKAALYNYEFKEENISHNDYSKYSNEQLYDKLLLIDPNTKIHINNRQRVERALDSYLNNTEVKENIKSDKLLYDAVFIGLTTKREELYNIINNRVDKMIENGLLVEARKIYDSNIRTKAVLTPIGYKELFLYFDNNMDLDKCITSIKQSSRRYAKRQYTWFNNQMNVNWFDVNLDNFNETINNVLEYIKKRN